jgi:predicted DNA-binding transcriptional regulator YafY
MLASRLLTILMLLQSRGRMSARALAAEVEVSVRTLYRDIDQLSAAGAPVYAERGRAGGFQLLDGYRTKLTGMTSAEAEALFLAGVPGPASDLGLGQAMATAQLKLLAALPPDWRGGVGRLGARFHLDPVGWFRDAERVEQLPSIADAVWAQKRLRLRYRRWSGEVDRLVEPLGVVLKAGVWYLVGLAGGQPRTYRVSSVLAAEVEAGEGFERPTDFDLAAYWDEWTARFEAGLYRATATVRISQRGRQLLERFGSPAQTQALAEARTDADGWMRADIPIESIDKAVEDLTPLGPEVEILAPDALRQLMARAAAAMQALYAEG